MNTHAISRACTVAALVVSPITLTAQEEASRADKVSKEDASPDRPIIRPMTFGWPFLDPEEMKLRTGNTTGTKVTLDPEPSDAWRRLQEEDLTAEQKDRRAILAMAGNYRVSFQFVETMGFAEDYTPARPYFTWGTEEVRVITNNDHLITLQHTLVMYFKDEEGKESGPMVMKHWRQDWKYEDNNLHTYRGDRRWRRALLPRKNSEKRWTQAVYQVDDSPRYEALGWWRHTGGMSTWTSVLSWRPLPRREFEVRDDYNVLECAHVITITPDGWVHTQNNRKLDVQPKKDPVYVARELGINRYERISAPDLKTPADEYYNATGRYWREVRTKWSDVYRKYEQFRLKGTYDDQKLWQLHFAYADKIQENGTYQHGPGRKHARTTIDQFLEVGKEDASVKE